MRISVNTDTNIIPLEVADDLELENFKALCEMEVGIPVAEMMVLFNARQLTDNQKSLKDFGVKDGDIIMICRTGMAQQQPAQQRRPQRSLPSEIGQIDFSGIQLPGVRRSSSSSAAMGQSLSAAVGQTPSAAVGQTPSAAVGQTPSAAVGQNPSAAVGQNPSAVVGQNPSAAVGQNPSAAVGQNPSAAVDQTPSAAVGQTPSAALGQTPSAALGQTPSAAVGQTPSAAVGQTPSAAMGQTSSADNNEGQVAGQEANQEDPAMIRDMLLANPEQLALLRHNNPKLAESLLSGGMDDFVTVLREQQEMRRNREQQRIRLLAADPFDMEAQRLIASEIQQENINANMEAAMEYNPESFGTVHMLYINCKVNGHEVKSFIDSGAQTTIMSQACAERCNIMRLMDTRWGGIAKGVGTQKIIGRIHMSQIQIENDFLASSFSILEDQTVDMLLGLDMLRRHQMCIDLKNNKLHIGTTGTVTNFLGESELPDSARLTSPDEEEAMQESEKTAKELDDRVLAEALAASSKNTDGNPSTSGTNMG
ncbi:protein DDI1 homolog 2-like isoform X2 [Homarus americanus]|uniref:protein DDI1 homolog 2-like isoform X2 n=1 Tax=Homarus americanus TaxID=6706 RepID=UPI001C483231|nr:protein DDI1 homolog 2-like isoform X2 [Homarus americanus]